MGLESRNDSPSDVAAGRPYDLVIAEDDDDIRDALTQLFLQDGFEVTQVPNGELLVQHLESRSQLSNMPDLLILDHRMPGYNGLDILRVLQQLRSNIPVVMITAFGREVLPVARSLGACAVFEKPFDHDDLRTAVYFYLGASRDRSATGRSVVQPIEDGDLDRLFCDSWEVFEVWIRQTLGGDFAWQGSPRDTPERRQIIIDSIRDAMASNNGTFPERNAFLERIG